MTGQHLRCCPLPFPKGKVTGWVQSPQPLDSLVSPTNLTGQHPVLIIKNLLSVMGQHLHGRPLPFPKGKDSLVKPTNLTVFNNVNPTLPTILLEETYYL